ncbi:MAG: response regulator [Planctomycetes bacterium]|nr:response regulator [Planctomycetota bacterium]
MLFLIVDDEAPIRALLKRLILQMGHAEVVEAADGGKGLDLFRARRPDCVLLDLEMPGVDGLAFLRQRKEVPGWERSAVLVVTGSSLSPAVERAILADADHLLRKPFPPEALAAAIRLALERRSSVPPPTGAP